MEKPVSLEFFEWRQRVVDIKEDGIVIDQITTPDDEPSLYEALYSNNRVTVRKFLSKFLNGRKLYDIYMHDVDKPEKYADVIYYLITRNSIYGNFDESIAEVMQVLTEERKKYYRGQEYPSYTRSNGKEMKGYTVPTKIKKLPNNLSLHIEDEYWCDPAKVRASEALEGNWNGGTRKSKRSKTKSKTKSKKSKRSKTKSKGI